ncbi:nucleotide exchange factor GrpE [Roseomonas sp. CCTCC AB2023176]|uniref:nucleotide exchange factor GrpE n=1 Tax=Roseomonas sp. CCTCC AB2023176 TaxID=3342640 RepID=UPI0035D5EECA
MSEQHTEAGAAPTGAEAAAPASDLPPPNAEAAAAALADELNAMRDKWLRAEAEMQNLRARHKRELDDARAYAVTKFARDVVEAADNLRRGLDALPPAGEGEDPVVGKIRGGIEGVERAFLGILERNGIAREDPAGKPFDPERHQAMAEQPAPEGVAPGTVVTAWTPAWTLNGRLLKPAMVVVAGKAG